MADDAIVHIGENSPEHVAYKLMERIAEAEGKNLHRSSGGQHKAQVCAGQRGSLWEEAEAHRAPTQRSSKAS
jgi:hypothetical protein